MESAPASIDDLEPIDRPATPALRQALQERQLSDRAYAQRRAMLLVAAAAFAITWGGIRLSEITLAGITLTPANERNLVAFTGLVLAYLIGNFATQARPGIVEWKWELLSFEDRERRRVEHMRQQLRTNDERLAALVAKSREAGFDDAELTKTVKQINRLFDEVVPKANARHLDMLRAHVRFEYAVPVWLSLLVLASVVARLMFGH